MSKGILVKVVQRNRMREREREEKKRKKILRILGLGSHGYEGWQVQNLQSRLSSWRPREELILLNSEANLLAKFFFLHSFSIKAFN
jgi:hypothetical protein